MIYFVRVVKVEVLTRKLIFQVYLSHENVPFYIDGVHGGFMRVGRIMRLEKDGLYFEFQVKDALVEAYKSSVKTHYLALKDIDAVETKMDVFLHTLMD